MNAIGFLMNRSTSLSSEQLRISDDHLRLELDRAQTMEIFQNCRQIKCSRSMKSGKVAYFRSGIRDLEIIIQSNPDYELGPSLLEAEVTIYT